MILLGLLIAATIAMLVFILRPGETLNESTPGSPPSAGLEEPADESGASRGTEQPGEGHALAEQTDETFEKMVEQGTAAHIGEASPAAIERALKLAELWPAFDTRDGREARAKQLSAAIPNADEWADYPAVLENPNGVTDGLQDTYSISIFKPSATVKQDWTFSINGDHNVAVSIPFSAIYYAGSGNHVLGKVSDAQIWQFKLSDAGELLEVTPPQAPIN
ncbi:hypothetical protein ACXR2T_07745 [Leucobacter sp. HY1910]